MKTNEIPIEFQCAGCQLFGVIHRPVVPNRRGIVILTGGYCCGPHRWFVLQARDWALAGYPVLRFSTQGTGDSEGGRAGLDDVQADLSSAIDEFFRREPSLEEVILWGVCAQASAALLYSPNDSRVSGVVLVNLYLQSHFYLESHRHGRPLSMQRIAAMTYLRYSLARISNLNFWKEFLALRTNIDWNRAFRRIGRQLLIALGIKIANGVTQADVPRLSDRLVEAFREFKGRVLFIFSGRDLEDEITRNILAAQPWQQLCSSKPTTIRELREADHMFSRRAWSDQASTWMLEWLRWG